MHAKLSGSVALAALMLAAQPSQASTTLSLLYGTLNGTVLPGSSTSGSDTLALDVTGTGGATLKGEVMADIGVNRLYVSNSPLLGFGTSDSVISGLSFWGDSLSASSTGSGPVHMNVNFAFDGTYNGPTCVSGPSGCVPSDNPSSTYGNAYFAAVKGKLNDVSQNASGLVVLHTDAGEITLMGQDTELPAGSLLDVASICEEDDGAEGCDPFATGTTFALDFAVDPGEDFFIASYFFVGNLAQGETVDAFHTLKLTGITLDDDGANLTSASGKITRLSDGSFGITSAVPEPATWALMIAGFGLVGCAARRRKPQSAAVA